MVLALVSGWYFVVLYRRSFGSGVMFGIDSNRVWLPPVLPPCRAAACVRLPLFRSRRCFGSPAAFFLLSFPSCQFSNISVLGFSCPALFPAAL